MVEQMLNEEERMLQDLVRDFADRELSVRAREADEKEEFHWENWKGMAKLGLTGIGIDAKYGGTEGGYRQIAIAAEEVARGDSSASVTLIANLSLGTSTIYRFGNEEQKQRLIPGLASGQHVAAWALTEPGGGSDAAALQTTATLREGNYFLNGTKIFITNADVAESIVVFATQDRSQGYRCISAFVVPKDAPGLTVGSSYRKIGWRASDTHPLFFEDCRVPEGNLLGERGRGLAQFMKVLDGGRVAISAMAVGLIEVSLQVSLAHALKRRAFGKPLSDHQAIQFKLADMAVSVDLARLATYRAATLVDQGLPHKKEAAIAKLFSSEAALQAVDQAVQIHGGLGYMEDSPIARFYRDAKALTIGEGTSEIQRMIIARKLGC